MMEREFVTQRIKEYRIQEFVDKELGSVGHSHTTMKKTPLGEKIIIHASRPGLVVGRRGSKIKELTKSLKKEFELENPQIEINEVGNIYLDANIVAEKIISSFERFGTKRFKGVGHKMMEKVMEAGARGVEIIVSGKVPGARARSWRFYQGYVKKSGDAALQNLRVSIQSAKLKPGVVGVKVMIMPPGIELPDDITLVKESGGAIKDEPIDGKENKIENEEKDVAEEKTDDSQGLVAEDPADNAGVAGTDIADSSEDEKNEEPVEEKDTE